MGAAREVNSMGFSAGSVSQTSHQLSVRREFRTTDRWDSPEPERLRYRPGLHPLGRASPDSDSEGGAMNGSVALFFPALHLLIIVRLDLSIRIKRRNTLIPR